MALFNPAEDGREVARYRDMRIARVVVMLLPEARDTMLPIPDRWAGRMAPQRGAAAPASGERRQQS